MKNKNITELHHIRSIELWTKVLIDLINGKFFPILHQCNHYIILITKALSHTKGKPSNIIQTSKKSKQTRENHILISTSTKGQSKDSLCTISKIKHENKHSNSQVMVRYLPKVRGWRRRTKTPIAKAQNKILAKRISRGRRWSSLIEDPARFLGYKVARTKESSKRVV